jgi:hypothetical protein
VLMKDGKAGLGPVVTECKDCLSKQERAEYDRLSTECLQDARKIIKDAVETGESWQETSLKISEANKERTAQMFGILENARQREQEERHGKG